MIFITLMEIFRCSELIVTCVESILFKKFIIFNSFGPTIASGIEANGTVKSNLLYVREWSEQKSSKKFLFRIDLHVTLHFIVRHRGDDMLINELAKLSGVSARTLRYYDEIGLLKPTVIEQNGYRQYNQSDVDRLQQILFYRELDFKLEQIKALLEDEHFDVEEALLKQQALLKQKRNYLNGLLKTIEKTIQSMEGEVSMSNEQKFEAFKNKLIEDNEQAHGQEIREKFGEDMVNASNHKLKQMTEAQYEANQLLEQQLFARLKEALASGDATTEIAMEVAELHKRWLSFYWAKYTKEAHAGLAQMYIYDERFIEYYDSRVGQGATQFLADAIAVYAKL